MPIAPTRQAAIHRLAELAGPENPAYIAVQAAIALFRILPPDPPCFPPPGGSCPEGTEGGPPALTPEAPCPTSTPTTSTTKMTKTKTPPTSKRTNLPNPPTPNPASFFLPQRHRSPNGQRPAPPCPNPLPIP